MKKHLLSLAVAASVLIASGCQEKPQPQPTGTIETLPAQSFKREWGANLQLKGDSMDRLFLVEDMVFAYTKKHMAYTLNKKSGVVRFATFLTDSMVPPHPPVVLKDRIIFPTDSTLEIYLRDGRFERSYKTSASLRTNAVGTPNGSRIYFGVDSTGPGRLVAVETIPGQYRPVNQKWELISTQGAPIYSAPAVLNDVIYVGFADGYVYAVNAESRAGIWSTPTGQTFQTYGPIEADLRADDFGVYVPSTDSKLYCLDKTQGKIKWQYYAGASLINTPDVTATMVYLPVRGKGVVAIEKTSGPFNREPKWIAKDAVRLVAEDEKYAYFHRADNVVIAIDKATGEQRFTSKRTDLVAFATNTRDGMIYAATRDGQVLAIAPVLKAGNVGEMALDDARPIEPVAMN